MNVPLTLPQIDDLKNSSSSGQLPSSDPSLGWEHAKPLEYLGTSSLITYARCPRKFFYQYLCSLQPAGEEGIALQFGSAIHRALPAILSEGDLKHALELFDLVWQDREGDAKGRTRSNAASILTDVLVNHGPANPHRIYDLLPPPSGTLRVADKYSDWEIPFTLLLPGTKLPIHSRIDGWARHRITNDIWALEYKTSQSIGSWMLDNFDMNLQVFLYALVLRVMHNQPVAGTLLHAIQTTKTTHQSVVKPIHVTDFILDSFVRQLTHLVLEIEHSINTRTFPQKFWACSGYGYFGTATFVCQFKNPCVVPKWTDMRDLYTEREYRPFVLEGQQVDEKLPAKKLEAVAEKQTGGGTLIKFV